MRKIVGSKKHNVYYATSGGSFENLAKHLVMLVSYKTYLKLYFSYKKNLKKTKTQNCLTLFCIICLSLFLPLSNLALRYSLECSVHFEIFQFHFRGLKHIFSISSLRFLAKKRKSYLCWSGPLLLLSLLLLIRIIIFLSPHPTSHKIIRIRLSFSVWSSLMYFLHNCRLCIRTIFFLTDQKIHKKPVFVLSLQTQVGTGLCTTIPEHNRVWPLLDPDPQHCLYKLQPDLSKLPVLFTT